MSMIPFGTVFDDPYFRYGALSPWGGWNNVTISPAVPLQNLLPTIEDRTVAPLTQHFTADIIEQENEFVIHVDLPGVQGLDVTGNQGILNIQGFREEPHEGSVVHALERSYGKVQRTFRVPFEIDMDNARATYKDGVLTMVFPKKSQLKRIKVN